VKRSGFDFLKGLPAWAGQGDFDLGGVRSILDYLGNPHNKLNVVHVAGTNGKGSTSIFIASILASTGSRVGLTLSPDMGRVNQRICIDGVPVSDPTLEEALNSIREGVEHLKVELSYFEAITVAAFKIFSEQQLDFVVIEVGLGGKKDATNVVAEPLATAIVTIGLDHQHLLGETESEIAHEKAGIARAGVPMIVGRVGEQAFESIYREMKKVKAPLFRLGVDFKIERKAESFTFLASSGAKFDLTPSLRGRHQGDNAAVAAELCQQLGVSTKAIQAGVSRVSWPARLETFKVHGRDVLLDCSHNPQGIASLLDYLSYTYSEPVDLCFGVLKTKNWQEMVKLLMPFVARWFLVEPESSMKLSTRELGEFLSSSEISFVDYGEDWSRFLESELRVGGRTAARPLVICGSIYMVSKLREKLCNKQFKLW